MANVRLSTNGWHRKIQEFTFGDLAPMYHSLCPYFWFTIVSIVFSPIAVIGGRVHSFFIKHYKLGNAISKFFKIFFLSLYVIAGITALCICLYNAAQNIVFALIVLNTVLSACGIFILIVYACVKIEDKTHSFTKLQRRTSSFIVESWKMFMGKYCPIITWID